MALFYSNGAYAIPSPELVIGSASALGQVFAVFFALCAGVLAKIMPRIGGSMNKHTRVAPYMRWIFTTMGAIIIIAIGIIIWQARDFNQQERARLEATLNRPAQFSGTKILDTTLKETSFNAQKGNVYGVSTDQAENLLAQSLKNPNIVVYDVRERAENMMGHLPNSAHVRFPDMMKQAGNLQNKTVLLYCHNGNRSSETCENLARLGIDCRFVVGGIEKWIVEGRSFSDDTVRGLSDLRAIPDYENKSTLLSTKDFEQLRIEGNIQIIDTRYPGDFATGHLPDAVNIPIRALPSDVLTQYIEGLTNDPVIVACYDRRSCFMGQVLGWELSQRGIMFLGRYTTPWDFYIPASPKPHIIEWLAEQSKTPWDYLITWVADKIVILAGIIGMPAVIVAVALVSRLLVLSLAIKSERDQLISARYRRKLRVLKHRLRHDPIRKARALKNFYKAHDITPLRNMLALLFLPVMMIGISAIREAAENSKITFYWQDTVLIWPILATFLAIIYLQIAVLNRRRARIAVWIIGAPILFVLVLPIGNAANLYLVCAFLLLFLQRIYVTEKFTQALKYMRYLGRLLWVRYQNNGIIPLHFTDLLQNCGNKTLRLSIMKTKGLPVPMGVLLPNDLLIKFQKYDAKNQEAICDCIWRQIGQQTCAIRSSACGEDAKDASFAGVYDSKLFVERDGLRQAILEVSESFNTERVNAYGRSEGEAGNILIQVMVNAQYAGVAFTQDPRAPGLMRIEMVEGTADDLVSGRITPQSFHVGRYTRQQITSIDHEIDIDPLVLMCQQIEGFFGAPQDIEWAYVSGCFHIVQSRDITTTIDQNTKDGVRIAAWQEVLLASRQGNDPNYVILEQDEMSEILPSPTPSSMSLISDVWCAGGSVDMAARALGISYTPSENPSTHLQVFMGSLYSNRLQKTNNAFQLSAIRTKRLEKLLEKVLQSHHTMFLPEIKKQLADWHVIDFSKMSLKQQCNAVDVLRDQFINHACVHMEKVNILAQFSMAQAVEYCDQHNLSWMDILNIPLPHSPNSRIVACKALPLDKQNLALLDEMGHRALFDYELSCPRYSEDAAILWQIVSADGNLDIKKDYADVLSHDIIKYAIEYQDMKEWVKHEALHFISYLRHLLLEIDKKSGLDGGVFYLTLDEISRCQNGVSDALRQKIIHRQQRDNWFQEMAPRLTKITLSDAEKLSTPTYVATNLENTDAISGTRVAGNGYISGRCFVVDPIQTTLTLEGFQKGDILVCQMLHPLWLPQMLEASAVLCEVGGWLSHMAIVAREKNITLFVSCKNLDQLKTGFCITIDDDDQFNLVSQELVAAT